MEELYFGDVFADCPCCGRTIYGEEVVPPGFNLAAVSCEGQAEIHIDFNGDCPKCGKSLAYKIVFDIRDDSVDVYALEAAIAPTLADQKYLAESKPDPQVRALALAGSDAEATENGLMKRNGPDE